MNIKKIALQGTSILALVAALLLLLFNTNPSNLPLIALFLPFLLLFLLSYTLYSALFSVFLKNIRPEYKKWVIGFLALLPVAFLLTLSAGQTDISDVILFALFTLLTVFYFSRTNFLK